VVDSWDMNTIKKLGGRDHTTVIHSCEKIKEELKMDTSLSQELDQIRTML
jgi:chromosomal replication initiation ATPase DnaA